MKTRLVAALILGLIGLLALATPVIAGDQYILEFTPTQNALPGVRGTLTLNQENGGTVAHFKLRGAYPNTVYTIWIVYNKLVWPVPDPTKTTVPSIDAALAFPEFPREGNAVAPLARLDRPFTDGMGLDQGLVFLTDANGNGEKQVKVDYNLISDSPVGNKDIIIQCAPAPAADGSCTGQTNLGIARQIVRVTTTWLRKYIGEYPVWERASQCANYDPAFDPDTGAIPPVAGINARYWQCVDPTTLKDPDDSWSGLPRVHRFQFDHFRLAPHPDALTHGLIGGSGVDHFIDMVGLRADLVSVNGFSAASASSKAKGK